ncbi:hypothetical protein [Lewinella sp. LCG006]|uniref:hypothetical protein n=1 Tax=Lewinella sp. LCG006 TaxID=3231911 RepID=UPI00346142BC
MLPIFSIIDGNMKYNPNPPIGKAMTKNQLEELLVSNQHIVMAFYKYAPFGLEQGGSHQQWRRE